MNRKHSGGINIGTSSILVTFVLLALVTFAALSYLSAKSDYKLSKEAADRTASYYDANRMAELYLENIEEMLTRHKSQVSTKEEYYSGIADLFKDNERISVEAVEGKIKISYVVAITNGQNLEVGLIANYPEDENRSVFLIDKWATATNEEWLEEIINEESTESGVKLLF